MQADILREKFLNFFKSKKHKIVESDSLVPKDDPTVLFTPAGMNQFKKEFLGFDAGYKRATTSQRCLRTDDLDKVGKTRGHHTFFEMLGNFSFGDYFKKEAIAFAWEFLTGELKINQDRLWVSVYKDDDEAYEIWDKVIKVPKEKIIRLGDKENFWPSEAKTKGPNGPCGPCSEIFFDQGLEAGCGKPECSPACDCGRFLEVWNLVFTQLNRKEGGALEPLPQKNIDTGMGLERLAAVMQGVSNNFETDLFQPLVKEIKSQITNSKPEDKKLIYAIADHIRAITFAIYDGVMPSNEGRGYVIRKVIRKSILHLRALGITRAFLYKLVPALTEIMHKPYPDLAGRKENISQIILAEENNFISTLDSSQNILEDKFKELLKKPDASQAGRTAFQLYDTYGLPLEITGEWLKKHKLTFSQSAFDEELNQQKTRSKSQSVMKGDVFSATEDLGLKETKFLGYNSDMAEAKILTVLKNNQELKKITPANDLVIIVLDKTPFYAESGGQVGDTGEIKKGKNIFEVLDTKKIGKAIAHVGKVKQGAFKKSDSVNASINVGRRLAIRRNHTATHLLQAALRKVLGAHVRQQGSLVTEEKLRFDFTHFTSLTKEQIERIEELVYGYIISNYKIAKKIMPLSEAKKSGALAFFGEKYSQKVQVVSISDISKEFCGGTHLDFTGQIGLFRIVKESSIASQVRRIEAVTGTGALKFSRQMEENLKEEAEQKIAKLLEQLKQMQKQQKSSGAKDRTEEILKNIIPVKDFSLIWDISLEPTDIASLRISMDALKLKTKSAVIALGGRSVFDGKAILVMNVTEDLVQKGLDASKLIVKVAEVIGGSGGGRKNFAQAGGSNPDKFDQARQELVNIISNLP